MYWKGEGLAQNPAQAVFWFQKAAEQGNVVAQFTLGSMYESGQGVALDLAQAVAWYTKAADGGNGKSQYTLGMMYENGRGVPRDRLKGQESIRKSAEQGNEPAIGWMREAHAITEEPRMSTELEKKGLDYANKSDTLWKRISRKNEMTDKLETFASSWQKSENGAGAEVIAKCENKDILFTATVLDNNRKPTVKLLWTPTSAELTLPVTIHLNDDPSMVRVRKHDGRFENTVPLILLRHEHWGPRVGDSKSQRDKTAIDIDEYLLSETWGVSVQFDTSLRTIANKHPNL